MAIVYKISNEAKVIKFKTPLDYNFEGVTEAEYIYHEYPKCRDIVFIFGAGTSYAEGAPLQSEIIPYIYESEDKILKESLAYRVVTKFLNTYFVPNNGIYPSLEQVYGYIEYHINNKVSLNNSYSLATLENVKKSLNCMLYYIVDKHKKKNTESVYSKFWDKICKINRNISIISLNYDTLLEESFDNIYLKKALIDYCIDFMNYDIQVNVGFNWWIDPRKPISLPIFRTNEEYDAVPIKIIKPHGSLNWRYCNCCNRVMLINWENEINLNNLEFEKTIDDNNITGNCPYDSVVEQRSKIPGNQTKAAK